MIYGRVNRPPGHNSYCGPAAVSILAGVTTNEAARTIRSYSRAGNVRGVWDWDLLAAIRDYGFQGTFDPKAAGCQIVDLTDDAVRIVVYKNHFSVVWGGRYCCGKVNGGRPLALAKARRIGRETVTRAYRVAKLGRAVALGDAAKGPDEQIVRAVERHFWG